MMIAGALCGLCVGWTYRLLFNIPSAATWLMYNLAYVAMFVLLGVASVIVYDPVTTIPALIAANEPPRALFRQAMPLTVGFTILSSTLMALLWGRTLLSHAAILLTCTILVVLLGLNISVLGLVHLPSGTAYLIAEAFGLILAINLAYVAVVLMLEKKTLFRLAASEGTVDGLSTPTDEKRPR